MSAVARSIYLTCTLPQAGLKVIVYTFMELMNKFGKFKYYSFTLSWMKTVLVMTTSALSAIYMLLIFTSHHWKVKG